MSIKEFFQRKKKPTGCVYRRDVLEYALTHKDCTLGLCRAIYCALRVYGLEPDFQHLGKYIPAFTQRNALQFGGRRDSFYWWPIGKWDTGREAFLRWLIKQYKNDTTNLLEIENDQN